MRILALLATFVIVALGVGFAFHSTPPESAAGRWEIEYTGALQGGSAGVGAKATEDAGTLTIALPAVSASMPALTFVGALPDQTQRQRIGDGPGQVSLTLRHPKAGTLRATSGWLDLRTNDRTAGGEFLAVLQGGVGEVRVKGAFQADRH